MLHVGDVTKINGAEVPKVNVITFGAPCQDLSIAGKRAGMKNVIMGDKETTRSGLFFEAIRIIKEMREDDKRNGRTDVNIRPRFAVYENVPGAFSSNHGEDFRAVLEETAKVAKGMPAYLDLRAENGHQPDVSWEMGGALLGEYTMRSFGECPSEERESRLSQILEAQPHPKYCLSAKACQGILRRAENRGKTLPPMLDQALRRQAGLLVSKNEQENPEGAKES